MKLEPKALTEHLRIILCGGLVPDAVLFEGFKCTGASVEKNMLFISGGLSGAEALPNPIGVVDLERMVKVLEMVEEPHVNLTVDDTHIQISCAAFESRLVHASPETIGSRIDEEVSQKLIGAVTAVEWHHLQRRFVAGLQAGIQKLNLDTVLFDLGKKSKVVAGDTRMDSISFDVPEIVLDAPKTMTFLTALLGPILKGIGDFTKAQFCLVPEHGLMGIKDGGSNLYIVSAEEEGQE